MSAKPPTWVGNTLDLVISRDSCDTIRPGSVVSSEMVSDHSSVHCALDLEPHPPEKRMCKYRRLGAIDRAAFREDLQTLPLLVDPEKEIGQLAGPYCHDLAVAAEKHAPEKSRVLHVRPHVSWYTEESSQAKRTRRQYEDIWRKSGLTVHRQMVTVQRQVVKDLIDILNSKCHFFASALEKLHALVLSSVLWTSCYTIRSGLHSQNTLQHSTLSTASAISSTRL